MGKPSILLLNNHPFDTGNPGQVDGLQLLSRMGEIGEVSVVNCGPRPGETQEDRDSRVVGGIRASKADVILALSLKDLICDMTAVEVALSDRALIYWEGDAWGRGKPVPLPMSAWMEMSTLVFSVGGPPQTDVLQGIGAKTVHHTIHTYDHVLFGTSERGSPRSPELDVVFIGSHLSRIPLMGGLPGSAGRRRLVRLLKRWYGDTFLLGGPGWPPGWSAGRVRFDEQDRFIQRGRLLANWDHFPKTEAYASDRLAIAMIAGRAQVTTLHPYMEWAPGPESGVFLEATVKDALNRTRALLELPRQDLAALGKAAHDWARHRVSHREAMRHMLSTVFPEIKRPPSDPWDRLPGPWHCNSEMSTRAS